MKTPYLEVVDRPRKMAGKGAPRETIFGVLGHTKEDGFMKSLGGLVRDSKAEAPAPPTLKDSKLVAHHENTERGILGKASKTHIPGVHHSMIPYPGVFMSAVGKHL